jgi:capsule polysaccharide export protein KpsE/RkpR
LRASEDRLLAFSQANRRIQDSPDLIAQRARLERDVTMQQQIYTTLAQAYEQAKIEEVRDTPVLTVITPPEVPARPDSRRLAVKGALLTALLLLFGVGVAITTDSMRNDGDEADRAMLGDEWRRTRSDLLRPHRLIFGSRPARSV